LPGANVGTSDATPPTGFHDPNVKVPDPWTQPIDGATARIALTHLIKEVADRLDTMQRVVSRIRS
jgi:hypothetical protein